MLCAGCALMLGWDAPSVWEATSNSSVHVLYVSDEASPAMRTHEDGARHPRMGCAVVVIKRRLRLRLADTLYVKSSYERARGNHGRRSRGKRSRLASFNALRVARRPRLARLRR